MLPKKMLNTLAILSGNEETYQDNLQYIEEDRK